MSMQQFCLRWNNHQPNFISVFSNLLSSETLVDVTLAAEGRHLQAHKVVLSACSTYFQSLFTINPCQHPIVILKDVKFSDLKIMVDFMYYGEVNISQDQLPSIIKTAESLKIKGLAEMHIASLTKRPSSSSEQGAADRGKSCSPSPSPLSPSFRRKRLKKTSTGSTSGSGDKTEEINEIALVATDIVKSEPLIVSQESDENVRRPVNTSTESQRSIDEDQISIMSNMENSSTTMPAQSDGTIQNVNQQSSGNVPQSSVSSQPPAHQALQYKMGGSKRGRLLMRQPRVKKEPSHLSPDNDPNSPHIVSSSIHLTAQTLNVPQQSSPRTWEETRSSSPPSILVTQSNLLTVTTPTNLLSVPQPSYLTKQHSHPLLSSQQSSTSGSNYLIQRQHSNPEFPGRTTSPSIVVEPAPIVKTEEDMKDVSVCEEPILVAITNAGSSSSSSSSNIASGNNTQSASGLRVKTTELRRSSSSPQTISRLFREATGDQRLAHCPVLRPGPALGCNHCWNTMDARRRILRRKTKYHCPECKINLCIVPCFQEYHEQRRELISKLKPLPKTSSV